MRGLFCALGAQRAASKVFSSLQVFADHHERNLSTFLSSHQQWMRFSCVSCCLCQARPVNRRTSPRQCRLRFLKGLSFQYSCFMFLREPGPRTKLQELNQINAVLTNETFRRRSIKRLSGAVPHSTNPTT